MCDALNPFFVRRRTHKPLCMSASEVPFSVSSPLEANGMVWTRVKHHHEVRGEGCGEPGPSASPHIALPLCHPSLELRMGLRRSRAHERVTVTLSCVAPPGKTKTCFRILHCSRSGFCVCDQAEAVDLLFGLGHCQCHGWPKRRFQALLSRFHPGE